ncbi:IPT/TIG domain-containing protein [Desulfosarcina sp.]|uniref:IPT/TIG domain-containing protein n=1 Tax=Desulfosarcina sp. TaxID=2027861 RepID=UPI0035666FD1
MNLFLKNYRIAMVITIAAVFAFFLILPSTVKGTGNKLQDFLRLIQNAKSMNEISVAFEKARFSEAETKELEDKIKQPLYANKLKSLSGREKKPSISTKPEVVKKKIVVDVRKKRAIDRKATTMLRRLKAKPVTTFRNTKKAAKPKTGTRTGLQRAPSSKTVKSIQPMTTARRAPSSTTGTPAQITSLGPEPIRVGDRLTISGSNFGSARGSVELLLSGRRYICDLESWNDTRIEIAIPEYMDSVVRESGVSVRLWVKLQATSLGPTRDIELHPSIRDPEIVSVSSDEIMPGNSVAIEGRHLGGRGSIEFDFGSQLFRGNIREWSDTLISAGIPDGIGGLHRTRGQIIIRNDQGREVRHPIVFEPDKESVQLSSYHEIDRSWKITGNVETFYNFENFEMKEGWIVRSFRKEIVSGRGRAWYMLEPDPATNRIKNIITLDAPPFTCLRVASRVTIEGPRGTPYW